MIKKTLISALLLVGLMTSSVSAADKPANILVEYNCSGTIVRFQMAAGISGVVNISTPVPGGTVTNEFYDTTARTIPLEILSVSGYPISGNMTFSVGDYTIHKNVALRKKTC